MADRSRFRESKIPLYLGAFAALFGAVTLVETVLRAFGLFTGGSGGSLVFEGEFLIGVATTVPFVLGIGYVSFWLPRSELDEARYPRILRWLLRGAVLSLSFNLLLVAVIEAASIGMFVAWVRWSLAVGSGLGLVIGVSEGRAIQKSIEAELAKARSDHLSQQRDLLDYLNSFLRHEGLNTTQVISGHAKFLMDAYDPESDVHAHSETIYRRSEDITTMITDVRLLLKVAREELSLKPTDVASVLTRELEKVADSHENVDIVTEMPDEAYVRANSLLKHVFGNLLTNAVEHNESEAPRVRVSVTTAEEVVTVDVVDNGDGISDESVSELFSRPDSFATDHGLGLYLVGRLVDQYGGTVELVETGDDGSVFRVALPRLSPDSERRPPEPEAEAASTPEATGGRN